MLRSRTNTAAWLAAGAAFITCAGGAVAATLSVPAQYTTIQAAINAAAAGDTVLVSAGFYQGAGNVALDPSGKAITIRSTGGAQSCTLDGRGAPILDVHSGETSKTVISGFTVEFGESASNGAVIISSSSPTISNCNFHNNIAGSTSGSAGGAIAISTGSPIIKGCAFYNNVASNSAGAIFVGGGAAKITGCTFEDNQASGGGGAVALIGDKSSVENCSFLGVGGPVPDANTGGQLFLYNSLAKISNCLFLNGYSAASGGAMAIGAGGQPSISFCTFDVCESSIGGAIYITGASPIFTGCDFYHDSANSVSAGQGGGAVSVDNISAPSDPVFKGCLFHGNDATYGAAVNTQSNGKITCCSFIDNLADVGGAIYAAGGSSVYTNDQFNSNSAANAGGGGAFALTGASTKTTITNCSFATNSDADSLGAAVAAGSGSMTLVANSILWDAQSANPTEVAWDGTGSLYTEYSDVYGGSVGTNNIDSDPLYVNAGSGGLYLQNTSPCIDAGSSKAPDYPTTDFDGTRRDATAPDMGAYENPAA